MKSIKIVGTGASFPSRILTNAELEQLVDTSDEWITERTGIKERRIADADTSTSDLCAGAVREACEQAGIDPSDLDAVIVGTSTTDTLFPSTACWVQRKLGIKGMPAFDVSAGCSGFLYGLELATSLVASGTAKKVAVVGGEVMSKVLDWKDRRTCVLFGDGAGAAIVTPGDGRSGVLASNWGADGNLAPILYQPAGGSQKPATHATVDANEHTVHMEGNTVFKHAVVAMSNAAVQAMKDAEVGPDDVKLLVPAPGQHADHGGGARADRRAQGQAVQRAAQVRQHVRRHDPGGAARGPPRGAHRRRRHRGDDRLRDRLHLGRLASFAGRPDPPRGGLTRRRRSGSLATRPARATRRARRSGRSTAARVGQLADLGVVEARGVELRPDEHVDGLEGGEPATPWPCCSRVHASHRERHERHFGVASHHEHAALEGVDLAVEGAVPLGEGQHRHPDLLALAGLAAEVLDELVASLPRATGMPFDIAISQP